VEIEASGLNNSLGDFGSLGFAGIDNNIPGVPEPGTVPLLCVGLLVLTLYGWQVQESEPPWSAGRRGEPRQSRKSLNQTHTETSARHS
jgi:hypothetical protein